MFHKPKRPPRCPPECRQGDIPGTKYVLNGFKWFSSATDSHIALALARTGPVTLGSRSLSLFLVPLRLPLSVDNRNNGSNNIFVHRLKNKFGTQIVPTAELSLEGTEAYLLGPLNGGVKTISSVLNITRLYCASRLHRLLEARLCHCAVLCVRTHHPRRTTCPA